MADPIIVTRLSIETCDASCKCQEVHLLFLHSDGEVIAACPMPHSMAREVAKQLIAGADRTEARLLAQAGRLT